MRNKYILNIKYLLVFSLIFSFTNRLDAQLVNTGAWSWNGTTYSSSVGCNTVTASAINHNNGTLQMSKQIMDCDASTYSETGIYGGSSLVINVDWDSGWNGTGTGSGWGELTFTFDEPVDNPVIHIERLGGNTGKNISNSALLTITTPGLTLTKLMDNKPEFEVTSTTITNTPNVDYSSTGSYSECGTQKGATSGGSVRINGTKITSVTFKWERNGPIGAGDAFEIAWSYPPGVGVVDLSANEPCLNDPLNLIEKEANVTWEWSGPNNFTSTVKDPTISNSAFINAGTYYVTANDGKDCMGYGQIDVKINPLPNPDAGSNQENCTGTNTDISATGGISYKWDSGLGTGQTHTVSPTTTTTYTVTVTDAKGCKNTDDVTIKVNPNPTPTITGSDFCIGTQTELDAGSGYSSYLWNTNEKLQYITITSAGTYSLTIVDVNGCKGLTSVDIKINPLPNPTILGNDFCQGNSATLDAGSGYNNYAWSSGGNSQTITATSSDTYTVTVTDINGCKNSDDITIAENANPTPTITGNDFCTGASTNIDAGSGYSSYIWNTGETSQTIVSTTGGTFSVTVTNAFGCEGYDDITITENSLPTLSITGQNFCQGDKSILKVGNIFSSYIWSSGETTQAITTTNGGTYAVTVTDANGCEKSDDITISEFLLPTTTITGNDFCEGSSSILDAGGNFKAYNWSSGGTTKTIVATSGKTYTVTVTDANGCKNTDDITIAENPLPLPSITGNDFCDGKSTELKATAGFTSYIWSNAKNTANITVNSSGTYTVTVTDAYGCIGSNKITVTENPNPTPNISGSISFCAGSSTTLDAGNGYSSYLWNTTATTQNITINTSGSYSVTVTDANGCSATDQVNTIESAKLTPIILGAPSICSGSSTILDAGVDYNTYKWSTSEGSQTINANAAGTYSVTVSDINGCTGSTSINVVENNNPVPSIIGNNFCIGDNTTLSTSNSYKAYKWSTNQNSSSVIINTSGNYTITVTDNNGCQGSSSINITEHQLPIPTIVGNDFCSGNSETLTLAKSYNSYIWNTSVNTATTTVNTSGTYSVTVIDVNGCENSDNITIKTLSLPTPTINGDNFCSGKSTILDAGTYTGWAWNTSEKTQTISINTGGTYSVTVTDAKGCKGATDINILKYASPTLSMNDYDICAGLPTTIQPKEDFPSYLWSTSEITKQITVSSSGVYVVTVTDANNCQSASSIKILDYQKPTPIIMGNDFCNNSYAELYTKNAYTTYKWNTSETTHKVSVNTSGTYSVTVTDNNNCITTASKSISILPLPEPNIIGEDLCKNKTTSLDAGIFNAYSWSTKETVQKITIGNPGEYSVTVTDNKGCKGSCQISIKLDDLVISVSPSKTICSGSFTEISATVVTGIPDYTYNWSNAVTNQTQTVNPKNSTIYSVFVVDGQGCISNTEQIAIDIAPDVELKVLSDKETICPGDPLFLVDEIKYGIPPYTLYDTKGNIVNLNIVTYPKEGEKLIYTVVDACNSVDTAYVYINFYDIPTLDIQADIREGCVPLMVHFKEGNITGSGYQYSWDYGDINQGGYSDHKSPIYTFKNSGLYDIKLSIITPDGCKSNAKASRMITVFPNSEAKFTVLPGVISILNDKVQFKNYSKNTFQYLWSFGDGITSTDYEPSYTYLNVNRYLVELFTISKNGCKDTAQQYIIIEGIFTLYAPTAFSPDSDNRNDYFYVQGVGIDEDNFNLRIFDRWGELIWQTNDLYGKWDGRTTYGNKVVQNGTYTWLVYCKDLNGAIHEEVGPITLIR